MIYRTESKLEQSIQLQKLSVFSWYCHLLSTFSIAVYLYSWNSILAYMSKTWPDNSEGWLRSKISTSQLITVKLLVSWDRMERAKVQEVMETCDLARTARRKVIGTLSKGFRQRLLLKTKLTTSGSMRNFSTLFKHEMRMLMISPSTYISLLLKSQKKKWPSSSIGNYLKRAPGPQRCAIFIGIWAYVGSALKAKSNLTGC